jgi:hypothetical protein
MGQFLVNTVAKVIGNGTETEIGNLGADLNDYYFPTGTHVLFALI